MRDRLAAGSAPRATAASGERNGHAGHEELAGPDSARRAVAHAFHPAEPSPKQAEPPPQGVPGDRVRGEKLLRRLEDGVLHLDRWIERFLPPALNPLAQLGAIANTCLIVAIVSGVALLFWYSPSVHQAYGSLETIRHSSFLGQLVRSLHRYSSDACLFLVLLHTARILLARRFTGPRWLGWVTGVGLLGLLWVIGWTGYWLVWDVRAQHLATGTARFIDRLPVFAEPLTRSFLTDAGVPSLLFFLIFFVHMLTPLAMGVALWMHLMRVNRPKLLTHRALTLWVLAALLVLSALLPATSAGPAQMTVKADRFTMDWWYLWPLALTDRLGGGMLWAVFLFGTLGFATVPWTFARRRLAAAEKATVDLARCFGCTLCAKDCPFNAITMVPREDGKKFAVQSQVNPDLCVGCGVCSGACDSDAINLPWLKNREEGARIHAWIDARVAQTERPFVAFQCAESAGNAVRPDGTETSPDLPGYRVCRVPCAGWVSAVVIERALARGAAGVLIVGCGEGDPACREGATWQRERLAGQREPKLDPKKADPSRVRFVQCDRTRRADLRRLAGDFRAGRPADSSGVSRKKFLQAAAGLVLTVVLGGVTYAFSDFGYRTPHSADPELVISFNHRGQLVEPRALSKEELARRLPHMRAQASMTRQRAPVRLRVTIDGRLVLDRSCAPRGLTSDGPSMAMERLPLPAGAHDVRVQIADGPDADKWTHQWEQRIDSKAQRIAVLLFDGKTGFTLHGVGAP